MKNDLGSSLDSWWLMIDFGRNQLVGGTVVMVDISGTVVMVCCGLACLIDVLYMSCWHGCRVEQRTSRVHRRHCTARYCKPVSQHNQSPSAVHYLSQWQLFRSQRVCLVPCAYSPCSRTFISICSAHYFRVLIVEPSFMNDTDDRW